MSEPKRTFVPTGKDIVTLSFNLLGGLTAFVITSEGFATSDPHVLVELEKYELAGDLKEKSTEKTAKGSK